MSARSVETGTAISASWAFHAERLLAVAVPRGEKSGLAVRSISLRPVRFGLDLAPFQTSKAQGRGAQSMTVPLAKGGIPHTKNQGGCAMCRSSE